VYQISILNHVLGPVMRGPSSSHTAGSYHLASMARSLLGEAPREATVAFDPEGSYSRTYAQQGADRAFAMGLLGRPLTDPAFFTALDDAPSAGLALTFDVRPLARPDHPNAVEIHLTGAGHQHVELSGRSIGGGEVEITWLAGWPVRFTGTCYELLVDATASAAPAMAGVFDSAGTLSGRPYVLRHDDGQRAAIVARRAGPVDAALRARVLELDPAARLYESAPVYVVQRGEPLFSDAATLVDLAESRGWSLGTTALNYESTMLALPDDRVLAEVLRRYEVMEASAAQGLSADFEGLQLLEPCAGSVFRADAEGRLPFSSPHTRAAARALAVMHVDGAMGVVCAAPTGGSAGTIPGALITLAEERRLTRHQVALALLAAGGIGVVVARRATFAAEVAGCQVEIGAAGAMAAAAVVDACGGTVRQACDAAAITFQNSMGLVCDPVQGRVEIPCHSRNAAAAAQAFVVADLVLGGYRNPIPLDETIDAVYAVGQSMPASLRCTAQGGLAITPSALACGRRSAPARD
jgi:L-serine dehydratase